MFVLSTVPKKTPLGVDVVTKVSAPQRKLLDSHSRFLLIAIDGKKTVGDLLHQSHNMVDLSTFEKLYELGLIESDATTATLTNPDLMPAIPVSPSSPQNTVADYSNISLSNVRFQALDILLDLSFQDFGIRPWVDRFENATSVEMLVNEILNLSHSEFGTKFPDAIIKLKSLIRQS